MNVYQKSEKKSSLSISHEAPKAILVTIMRCDFVRTSMQCLQVLTILMTPKLQVFNVSLQNFPLVRVGNTVLDSIKGQKHL